jgi:hypothetical protein
MNTVLLEDDHANDAPRWWTPPTRNDARPPPRAHVGAQRMAAALHALLDDSWTLVCGHSNPGGRIDHLLVGPRGVLAIACSALNGRMHCDGAGWRRDQFDLYNNLVTEDARVPGDPAGDLYSAAARLQQMLLGRTSIQQVPTALVFTHPAATLGRIAHAPFNLVTLLADLKSAALLQAMAGQPDHRTIDGVVEVIRHEHARFLRERKQGKRKGLLWRR